MVTTIATRIREPFALFGVIVSCYALKVQEENTMHFFNLTSG